MRRVTLYKEREKEREARVEDGNAHRKFCGHSSWAIGDRGGTLPFSPMSSLGLDKSGSCIEERGTAELISG